MSDTDIKLLIKKLVAPHEISRKRYLYSSKNRPQVSNIGESMNQRIPNGSCCLFKANPAGSREGKIVLVQHRDIQDPAYAGSYTIKVYHSEKSATDEGWAHQKIILEPKSNQPQFEKLYFDPSQSEVLQVIGEFVIIL